MEGSFFIIYWVKGKSYLFSEINTFNLGICISKNNEIDLVIPESCKH